MQRSSLPGLKMAMCVIFVSAVQCVSTLRSEELRDTLTTQKTTQEIIKSFRQLWCRANMGPKMFQKSPQPPAQVLQSFSNLTVSRGETSLTTTAVFLSVRALPSVIFKTLFYFLCMCFISVRRSELTAPSAVCHSELPQRLRSNPALSAFFHFYCKRLNNFQSSERCGFFFFFLPLSLSFKRLSLD